MAYNSNVKINESMQEIQNNEPIENIDNEEQGTITLTLNYF